MQAEREKIRDFTELDEFVDSLEETKGSLISVLHRAQDIYGYIPRELQEHIALKLGIPSSKVFGVVTFYSYLKMEPRGKIDISVCLGTACFVRGSDAILNEFEKQLNIKCGGVGEDGLFSLNSIRCVGACGLAPVVMIGEQVYGRVTEEDVRHIVDEQLAKEGME